MIKTIEVKDLSDQRGGLVALEASANCVPFEIKRMYCIYNTCHGESRGYHAHLNLKQVVLCTQGSCRFVLDNGIYREEVTLNSAGPCILIEGLIWREIHDITDDCVLIVLASEKYDEDDYIRNYTDFLRLANEK